jgi:azurin
MLRTLLIAGAGLLAWKAADRTLSAQPPGVSDRADTTIIIRTTGSTLEFSPVRISAKTGTRVTVRLVNEGTLPHNIVIPRSEDDIEALGAAAYGAAETGYVPLAEKAKLLGYSALASPGQSVDMTFVMPAPGEYRYVCLFPGHYASMLGTLRSLR